ncbi:MAG: heme A synthase [Hymenobacter sp.]|nr:MAG: heme A synthase [Hymenobacter sp.]
MHPSSSVRRFQFWSVTTVISVYLLILVGGVVRATGSGMGCPDWPKCFGQWVPPTSISELPADYKQVYTAQRVAKNEKLGRTLASLGFKQVAGEIFAHPTQYIETDFNAVKTWIEYLNRLLGALIGIFVFVTAVVSVSLSTATVHTISPFSMQMLLGIALMVTFVQIVLGTQVREQIDQIASLTGYANRESWVSQLGNAFKLHRSLSILVTLLNGYAAYLLWPIAEAQVRRLLVATLSILGLELVAGITLAYLALPAIVQPVHLTLATLLFGAQFLTLVTWQQAASVKQFAPSRPAHA